MKSLSGDLKHTALPWALEYHKDTGTFLVDGKAGFLQIARISTWGVRQDEPTRLESEANAEFIVKACNSHYQLVEALKLARKFVDKQLDGVLCEATDERMVLLNAIEKAISQAEDK